MSCMPDCWCSVLCMALAPILTRVTPRCCCRSSVIDRQLEGPEPFCDNPQTWFQARTLPRQFTGSSAASHNTIARCREFPRLRKLPSDERIAVRDVRWASITPGRPSLTTAPRYSRIGTSPWRRRRRERYCRCTILPDFQCSHSRLPVAAPCRRCCSHPLAA